jgi:hypothetical protein
MAPSQATKVRTRTAGKPAVTKQLLSTTTTAVQAIPPNIRQVTSLASTQLVDQRQSQELAQTLVHGSVRHVYFTEILMR